MVSKKIAPALCLILANAGLTGHAIAGQTLTSDREPTLAISTPDAQDGPASKMSGTCGTTDPCTLTALSIHFEPCFLHVVKPPLWFSFFNEAFTVNTEIDSHDARPGDGWCADACGVCSLRAAIEESNNAFQATATSITVPKGTYRLTRGQLDISKSQSITGTGANSSIIDGNDESRVFVISGSPPPVVQLTGLTIQNARGGFQVGGGVVIGSKAILTFSNGKVTGNKSTEYGGGITNQGYLQLTDSTVENNCTSNNIAKGKPCSSTPLGAGGGVTKSGGGLYNDLSSQMYIVRSTIANNRATRGGGLRNTGGHVEIANSTISGNTANTRGGGILNSGTLWVSYSTIAFNTANAILGGASEPTFGGGIYVWGDGASPPPLVDIADTILALNTDNRGPEDAQASPDCYTDSTASKDTDFVSFGGNIFGLLNPNCTVAPAIDQAGTPQKALDPEIDGLAFNGGSTETHALRQNSPAIDMGATTSVFPCPSTDQRGQARPSGLHCDVGAFELAH